MKKKLLLVLGVVVFVVAAGVPGYYFYNKYQKAQLLLKDPSQAAKQEVKALLSEVSQIIDLPEGEEPTIATVSDKDKLKEQSFFAKADNGDKLIIYTKSKKAILYRPSVRKVIEVAPVNIGDQGRVAGDTTAMATKVTLYNGAKRIGLTSLAEKKLASWKDVEVVGKENAANSDYEKTLIVDVTGKAGEKINELSKLFKAEISSLPAGESKPEADVLVILGAEYN